ncbi:MAG: patatin-like phospholipase family protein [Betaproteobacteria bacterium]
MHTLAGVLLTRISTRFARQAQGTPRMRSPGARAGGLVLASAALSFGLLNPFVRAAEADSLQPAASRPRVVLVLSGGGARGLAHIGVLKVLRDLRVPVDLIVATSMGSIVGGAYAAGHTPESMEQLVRTVDWNQMFADRAPRGYLSFRRKEDDLRFIGKSELGLKRDGVVLPRGAFGAQNLEEFLRLVARPASDARHLDELPIPLRAVATDLVTGELVVLRDVSLSMAMRASMSIPGAFAPTDIDGWLLGDGGLTRNLPVEVAREMAPDVIIAVNVGTPLLPRDGLASAFGVAQQMINILTEQNVAASIAALRPADVLISPDLKGYSFVDFEQHDALIARGEEAARKLAPRLQTLAVDEREYRAWETVRVRRPSLSNERVAVIQTRGAVRTNPEALEREIRDRTGVAIGRQVTDEQLVEASRVLYGMGEFERADVHAEVREGRKLVLVDVEEKAWGPDYLRIGGRAVSDLHTDARFSITLQHTRTWLNDWGAEWRNEIQLGDVRRFATSLYQPLGPGSPWFVEPRIETTESDSDIFGVGNRRTDRVLHARTGVGADFGVRLGDIGVARLGLGREWYRSTPVISSRIESGINDSANYARMGVAFDTLDDANFPRYGYLVDAVAGHTRYSSSDSAVQTYAATALLPFTWGRLTLLGLAGVARSPGDRGGFSLGGFLNLSGTPLGAISGSQAAIVAGVAYYRMGDLSRVLGRNWYAGMSLEAGNAWARREDMHFSDVRKAGSLFVGLDSVIGPLYLGWGKTFGGDSAVYLFLGRPTDRN